MILFSLFTVGKPPEGIFSQTGEKEGGRFLDIGQTRVRGVWCMSGQWVWMCRRIWKSLTLPVTQFLSKASPGTHQSMDHLLCGPSF